MGKTKRLFIWLLACMLSVSLLPVIAHAADEGELWINGVDIIQEQDHTVDCGAERRFMILRHRR